MNIDSDQSNLSSCNDSDVISFPTDKVDEVSKEEIGKWVDQLMEMPEPDSSSKGLAIKHATKPCCLAVAFIALFNKTA